MTPFELRCATTATPDPFSIFDVVGAVARVAALREAWVRRRRDLSQADWQDCVLRVYPGLSEHQRQNPTALLSAIAALRPPAGGTPYGAGLTVANIVDALVVWSGDWPPTQEDFADNALWVGDRRMRQVLRRDGLTWGAAIEEASLHRSR